MAKKTVLAIGIEPSLVDFSAFPGLTPELVRNYIQAQIEILRALGYDAQSCLIDLGETAEAVAIAAPIGERDNLVLLIVVAEDDQLRSQAFTDGLDASS